MAKKISSGYHIDQNGLVSRKGDITLKAPVNVENYSDLSGLDASDGDVAIVSEKTTIDGNVYPNNSSFIMKDGEWIALSGYASAEDVAKFDEIDNKVDKENGKGLSTNDFTNDDKTKLDNLVTPMQIKGRKDTVEELPVKNVKKGDVYLVGLENSGNFEEYVCVAVDEGTGEPTWEGLGPATFVQKQVDWDENDETKEEYIKNRTHYFIPGEFNPVYDDDVESEETDSYDVGSGYSFTPLYSGYTPTQSDVSKPFKVTITDKNGNKLCDGVNGSVSIQNCPKKNEEPAIIIKDRREDIGGDYWVDTFRGITITESLLLGATIELKEVDHETGQILTNTFTLTQENQSTGDQWPDGDEHIWGYYDTEEDKCWNISIYRDDSTFYAEYNITNSWGEENNVFYVDYGYDHVSYKITLSDGTVLDNNREIINNTSYNVYSNIALSNILGSQISIYNESNSYTTTYILTEENRASSVDQLFNNPETYFWFSGHDDDTNVDVTAIQIYDVDNSELLFNLLNFTSVPSEFDFEINKAYIQYTPDFIYTATFGSDVIYEDQPALTFNFNDSQNNIVGFSSENQMYFISKLSEYNPFDNQPFSVDIKEVVHDDFTKELDEKYLPDTDKYQGNWDENDENSNNYIKNRTHWKGLEVTSGYHFETGQASRQIVIYNHVYDAYDNIFLTENDILNQTISITLNSGTSVDIILDATHRANNYRDLDENKYWAFFNEDGATALMIQYIVDDEVFILEWCDTNMSEEFSANVLTVGHSVYSSSLIDDDSAVIGGSIGSIPSGNVVLDLSDNFYYSFDTAETEKEVYHKIDNNYQQGYYPENNLYGYGYIEEYKTENITCEFEYTQGDETGNVKLDALYSNVILNVLNLIGKTFSYKLVNNSTTESITITEENIDDYVTTFQDGFYLSNNRSPLPFVMSVTESFIRNIGRLGNPFIENLVSQNGYKIGTYFGTNVEISMLYMDMQAEFSNVPISCQDTFNGESTLLNVLNVSTSGKYNSIYHSPEDLIGTVANITYHSGVAGDNTITLEITNENISEVLHNFGNLPEGAEAWYIGGEMVFLICGANQTAIDYMSSSSDMELKSIYDAFFKNGQGIYLIENFLETASEIINITNDKKLFYNYKKISDEFLSDYILNKINSIENLPQQIEVNSSFDLPISLPSGFKPGDSITVDFSGIQAIPSQTSSVYEEFTCPATNGDIDSGYPNFMAAQIDELHYACIETNTILIREIDPSTNTTSTVESIPIDSEKLPSLQCIGIGDDGCIVVGGKARYCARIYEENDERVIDYIEIENNIGDYMHISVKNKDFFILSRYGNLFIYKDGNHLNKYIWKIHGIRIVKDCIYIGIQSYADGILPNYNIGVAFSDDFGTTWNRLYYVYGGYERWYGLNYIEDFDVVVALSPRNSGKVMWTRYGSSEYGICDHTLASASYTGESSHPAYEIYKNIFVEHGLSYVCYTKFYEKSDGTIDLVSSRIYRPKYSGTYHRQVIMSYVDTNNVVHTLLLCGSSTSYFINNAYYHIDDEDQLNAIFDLLAMDLDDGKYLFNTNVGYFVGKYTSSSKKITPIRSWTSFDDSGEISQFSYVYVKDAGDLYMQTNIQISEKDIELRKYIYPELNVMHNPDELDITEDELDEILN